MKHRGFISLQFGFLLCFCLCFLLACKVKHYPACASEEEEYGSIQYVKQSAHGQWASFRGIIKDKKNNEPMPNVKVIVDSNGRILKGGYSNHEGQFEINGLKEGKYTIRFENPDYETLELPLHIKSPLPYYNLTVQMKRRVIQVEKPIIYLYPTQKQAVHVQLNFKGQLQHSYPAYPKDGWHVIAEPNGTLYDEQGKEYYALFWEGKPQQALQASTGFVVAGKDCASFLEEKLAYLGLSRREANEFILYWLPRMENNAYNFIHFADADYTAMAELSITPEPQTLIRVMMLSKPLNTKMTVPEQDLSPLHKTRKGFTVVEWGGTIIETVL